MNRRELFKKTTGATSGFIGLTLMVRAADQDENSGGKL